MKYIAFITLLVFMPISIILITILTLIILILVFVKTILEKMSDDIANLVKWLGNLATEGAINEKTNS